MFNNSVTKFESPATVFLNKSFRGSDLNNPVVPKPLNSTHSEEPGGGRSTKGITESQLSPVRPPPRATYAAVAGKGKRCEPTPLEPPTSSPTLVEEPAWKTVTRRKNKKQHIPPTRTAFNLPTERCEFISNDSKRTKRKLSIQTQRDQEYFKKKARRKNQSISLPHNTSSPTAASSAEGTTELQTDRIFLEVLRRTNSDNLEVWWRMMGFERTQRGPVKVAKFTKALEAVGFTRRNGDGSQVTFNPPTEFEGSCQGLNLPCITLHIPHNANIEDIELRDKCSSIKEKYPIMVNTMYKFWKEM